MLAGKAEGLPVNGLGLQAPFAVARGELLWPANARPLAELLAAAVGEMGAVQRIRGRVLRCLPDMPTKGHARR